MDKTKYFIIFLLIIFVTGCIKSQDKSVSLNKEVILKQGVTVKIERENLEMKILKFIDSSCPPNVQCIWVGKAIVFEYKYNNEIKSGVNLVEAFGYKIDIIDTDYKTFAKLNVTKPGVV